MKIIKQQINFPTTYNIFDIKSLEIGQSIPFNIFIKKNKDYVIIIEMGSVINSSLYEKLEKQETLYIANKDISKQVLNPTTLKYYIRANISNVEKRLSLLYDVNKQIFDSYMQDDNNKIDIKGIELIVTSIVFLIKYDEDIIKNTMPFFRNNYNISNHALHVAIYAVKLGNLLNFSPSKLSTIATAALLHDVGYKKVDKDILNKEDKYCDDDTKEVQKHVRYGIEIIKHNDINDPNILNAILYHHERYDGSGYPHAVLEKDISDFASILGICDVFDALTNHRPHRDHISSFEALKMMIKDAEMTNKFNQNYLHLALKALQ